MDTVERGAIREEEQEKHQRRAETAHELPNRGSSDIEKGPLEKGSSDDVPPPASEIPPLRGLSFLDRFLVVWILLAMAIGIILGNTVPSSGPALQKSTFVDVSVPIAVGLLVMMYPILCKVRFERVCQAITLFMSVTPG